MKALVLEEYKKLVYKDVPIPEFGPDDVLIQVKACGICGSDAHGLDGSSGRRIPPLIMGHEASGVIAEIGANVKSWAIGDRVTFDSTIYRLDDWYTRQGMYNLSDGRMVLGVSPGEYRRDGAFAEYVAVPQHILYKIPEGVSYNQAAMVEPAAVAVHAVGLTPIKLNDTAVVVGAGMIGLFVIQALKLAGCGLVIAVDVEPDRLHLATALGADYVLQPDKVDVSAEVKKLSHGRGADVAVEAVGIAPTVQTAIQCVRRGATVTLVGNISSRVDIPLQTVVTQQVRLQGSCAIAGEYPAVLAMIESGRFNVNKILSATAPLSEGAAWFKRIHQKEPGLMKVILNP
ncbi:galactitol-1-phosphate 5-dehydrogenase [candidate division KSB1 bacterium]|nr:galactitol-1-phosphate 5-dehydrogenase [candidate division KSB1 bacterium]RQW05570.1 MAG: galactitol-1-phosphate 5-dehydrogenase [candidate division KSB1 bacterium]